MEIFAMEIYILLYICKYVCRKIPRSAITGSKRQCICNSEGYPIVFHTAGLFVSSQSLWESACLSGEIFEDRQSPCARSSPEDPSEREVKGGRLFRAMLVAPRTHRNESQRCQVCPSYSGSQGVLCSMLTFGRPFSEQNLNNCLDP